MARIDERYDPIIEKNGIWSTKEKAPIINHGPADVKSKAKCHEAGHTGSLNGKWHCKSVKKNAIGRKKGTAQNIQAMV